MDADGRVIQYVLFS